MGRRDEGGGRGLAFSSSMWVPGLKQREGRWEAEGGAGEKTEEAQRRAGPKVGREGGTKRAQQSA